MKPDAKQIAFLRAYEKCHEPFLRYCSAFAFGKMDAEDLVQDVLLSAYKHFDNLQEPNKLLHYLIRAAKLRAISFFRKRSRKQSLIDRYHERMEQKLVAPDVLADIQILYEAIQRLPEQQRSALILFEISGFSMKEIAEIQETTLAATKMKVSRARKKLSQLLSTSPGSKDISVLLKTAKSIAL